MHEVSHGGQQRGGGHVCGVRVPSGQTGSAPAQRAQLAPGPVSVPAHLHCALHRPQHLVQAVVLVSGQVQILLGFPQLLR